MFVRPRFTKPVAIYAPHEWSDVEGACATWPEFGPLVREIKARGMNRSIYGMLSLSGLVLSMGGRPGTYDSHLLVSRSVETVGHLTFEYVQSNRDPHLDWRATYPPDQVLSAFYRFVTRAGWFAEGHPMLAGLESGVPYVQA